MSGSAENKILDAAVKGDQGTMLALLQEDPCILDRVSYKKSTPLHVATMNGHLELVKEILRRNRRLAEELDAHQSSPVHVASSEGHLEIVRELLEAAPAMCFSLDYHGRNPIHVAAVKGQVEILKELVAKQPIAAREKTDRGLTVLHLCIKYQHLDAFLKVEPHLSDLIDCKDQDGNNVLHMAARYNQLKIVEYLVRGKKIDVHVRNAQGQTARKMLNQTSISSYDSSILAMLKPKATKETWLTNQRDAIMVVAILMATMAFQAGVTPPGGVLQEKQTVLNKHGNNETYGIGEAVMAMTYPKSYKAFMYVNSTGFVMSLSAILLLISGMPFKRKVFMSMLMVTMWLTITFIAATYAIAITVVTPSENEYRHRRSLVSVIIIALIIWSCLMVLLFGGNLIRLANRWVQRKKGVNIVELVRQWMHKKWPNATHSVGQWMNKHRMSWRPWSFRHLSHANNVV